MSADRPQPFYGPDQAVIHHRRFGDLADRAGRWLLALLAEAGLGEGTVVDLGCGSGILARLLTDGGYDVVGTDISPAMVALARREAPAAIIVEGSLFDFHFPDSGTVAVTAIGEALNYGTDPRAGLAALRGVAERVAQSLVAGGIFLLDVAGPGRNGTAGPRRQVFHHQDGWCLGMHADESGDGTRLDRVITIFSRVDGDTYRRVDEHHVLRLYQTQDVLDVLAAAGLDGQALPAYGGQATQSTPGGGWSVFLARKPDR